jgi:cephalosporin hydroxylase
MEAFKGRAQRGERPREHMMAETCRTLADLFVLYGTDKGSYAPAYELLFEPRRYSVKMVIEIGVGTLIPDAHSSMVGWAADHYKPGGSLRAWRDYFPGAMVHGIDVQPDTQFEEERIHTHLCDSTKKDAVKSLIDLIGFHEADFIVDDGSHSADDQISTLQNFYPLLKKGGIYIIEDVVGNGIHDRFGEIHPVIGASPVFFVAPEMNPIILGSL